MHDARRRQRGLALPLVGAILLLALVTAASTSDEAELAPLFTLPNLDGDAISLADYRGSVVILDFWATWCHLCVETFPAVQSLSETYADQGTVLLVICLDKQGDTARRYLIENDLRTDNVLWGSLTEAREVKGLFGVGGIAHTILIDRDGYIRYSGHPKNVTSGLVEEWLAGGPDSSPDSRSSLPPDEAAGAPSGT